jgi:hypothetical protein
MSDPSAGLSREARECDAGLKIHNPLGDIEPLVVKPRVAWILLQCSNTRGYELIAARELDSFKDGKSRKITVASIHRYIAKRLAEGDGTLAEAGKLSVAAAYKARVAKCARGGTVPARRPET